MPPPFIPERLRLDESGWCLWANRVCGRRAARWFFAAVSRLGDGLAWYALMFNLIVFDGLDGLIASAHLAATGLFALIVYKRLKQWTRRPRPYALDAGIRAWVAPLDEFSFPSGHTLHAVAFSWVAVAYYPGLVWLLAPFTGMVAVSRVTLGLHYPSDVFAAVVMGTVLAGASLWLASWASLIWI